MPAGLNLGLDEFYQFPEATLEGHGLRQEDRDTLLWVGLPKQAAPFLSFADYPALDDLPPGFYPIGSDGCGSNLCIELGSSNVVLLDHDFGMKKIFVNSSLAKFLECLCLFQEHLTKEVTLGCFEAMCQTDGELNCQGLWWQNEISNI